MTPHGRDKGMMRRTVMQAWAALIATGSGLATRLHSAQALIETRIKWVVFYGPTADEQLLSRYDIVILDQMFQGAIAGVAKFGARVCAYLSLGEVRISDSFYERIDPRALLEPNPAWPGTRRIDVRNGSWNQLVLSEIIPSLAAKGFTGLLLDTLDTPPYLELVDPNGNRGMRQAAESLVRSIRKAFPGMLVIVNRGYVLLPEIIGSVDGIIAESLLTRPDPRAADKYVWNESAEVGQQLALLAPAMHRQPVLPILSLDYWNPDDIATIQQIYEKEQRMGHHPYVATRMLDRIVPPPPI